VLWLAWTLSQGPSSVTPVDNAASSIVGYITSFGVLGVVAVAFAFGWLKSGRATERDRATARNEARADLEAELARTIARAEHAEEQRDEALKMAQTQLVPLLGSFTSTTGALIPLLQEVVRAQEGQRGGR
jgi:hypothetical protein